MSSVSVEPRTEKLPDITYRLDWLTCTLKKGSTQALENELVGGWKNVLPRWGYKYGREHVPTGAIIYEIQHHTDAPAILILSGSTLTELAHFRGQSSAFHLVHSLSRFIEGATRVDLAVDLHDGGLAAVDVADLMEAGVIKTTARKTTTMRSTGPTGGVTTYFGARTSPRMIRVYLKHEVDEIKEDVTRIEIELKKLAAQVAYVTYLQRPPCPTLAEVMSIMKQVVSDFGTVDINSINSRAGGLILPPRATTNYAAKEWLSRQVVPMLKRDYIMNGGEPRLLAWLINEVTDGKLPVHIPYPHEGTDS